MGFEAGTLVWVLWQVGSVLFGAQLPWGLLLWDFHGAEGAERWAACLSFVVSLL